MVRTFFTHLRQQWMGGLALFLVLGGGTAYAAATIGSEDVFDNSLRSVDIRNDTSTNPLGGLVGADLRPESVGTSEVANDSLTGTDTLESSLAKVPNADKLDGIDSAGFQRKCETGAIRGSVVIDGSADFPSTYTNQSGFNCSGGAIKARRTGGESSTYYVRFVGNPAGVAVGNAFIVADDAFAVQYITIARARDPLDGLMSFRVAVCQPFGGNCVSDGNFVLVVV